MFSTDSIKFFFRMWVKGILYIEYNGGDFVQGILSGGFCPWGDFVQGDFVQGDFVQRGLSGGILS